MTVFQMTPGGPPGRSPTQKSVSKVRSCGALGGRQRPNPEGPGGAGAPREINRRGPGGGGSPGKLTGGVRGCGSHRETKGGRGPGMRRENKRVYGPRAGHMAPRRTRGLGGTRVPNPTPPPLACLHMEVALTGGARLRGKILDFLGLGDPGRPGNPFKKVGGFAPHLFEGLPGRPARIFPLNLAPPC